MNPAMQSKNLTLCWGTRSSANTLQNFKYFSRYQISIYWNSLFSQKRVQSLYTKKLIIDKLVLYSVLQYLRLIARSSRLLSLSRLSFKLYAYGFSSVFARLTALDQVFQLISQHMFPFTLLNCTTKGIKIKHSPL